MSNYSRTQMARPRSETVGEAAARLSLPTLIQGVKRGSIQSMIVIAERIQDSYANHAAEILDALLPHLNIPPAVVRVIHTTTAFAAMGLLSDIFQWCNNNRMSAAASRITPVRLHENLDNIVYWSKRMLDGCNAKPDQPPTLKGYDTIGRFLYTLFLTPGEILKSLSKNTTMLGVAVDFATQTYQGSPIIHPGGRPSDPSIDHPDGPSAAIYKLARENMKGVVEVIDTGAICSPETFVDRIVHRMRCYKSLSTIPRLADLPEATSERMNVNYLIALTFQMMNYDSRFRELFLEAKVPEVYTSTLAAQLRLGSKFPDSEERSEFLLDLAVAPVRWWEMIKSEGALARAEEIAEGGMFHLIGSLLPYSRLTNDYSWAINCTLEEFDNRSTTIGTALAAILPYSLYPNVLLKSVSAMEKYVLPQIDTLPSDSPYRTMLPSLLRYLRNCGRLLPREEQEPLCDNMNHSSTHPANADGLHHIEKVCERCHSVAYCSRQCQKEDWATFHRDECYTMRMIYFERKTSNRWYSYSYRRFQTSMLRYAFESVEVVTTVLGPIGAGSPLWSSYSPQMVNNQVDPLRVMDHMKVFWTGLNSWVGREAPRVPEHLRPRFDAFLRAFVASFQIPAYKPGSLRLVARVAPLGDEEVTLLLLLRQAHPMRVMKGAQRQMVEMVKEFTLREPRSKSNFEIVGSLAFTGPCRERSNWGTMDDDSEI